MNQELELTGLVDRTLVLSMGVDYIGVFLVWDVETYGGYA